jgi:hypothetical protein
MKYTLAYSPGASLTTEENKLPCFFLASFTGAMTFSITTFSIKTLSIKGLFATLSIMTFSKNDTQHNSTLSVIMLMSNFIY